MIPFGEYLPDLPSFNNPGATVAQNVIPAGMHYEPFLGLNPYSDALDARSQGAFAARDTDGTVYNFAGDEENLYLMASASYAPVTWTTAPYTTGIDEQWNFTQYGRDVIATNFNDDIQVYTMGTSTEFDALAGSPPNARYISVVKNDFVVIGNLDTASYRVQWSPQGNPGGTWGTDPATLADYQDLQSEWGFVRQVVGGEYGVIFQDRAITRMTFVGSPLAFTFDRVESNQGTQIPGSVVKIGDAIFFYGINGFRIFNGSSSIPIGADRLDKTFFIDLDKNHLDRVRTVADQQRTLVFMSYPGVGNYNGRPNRLLIYNYSPTAQRRWAIVNIETECLCRFLAEGYTLDSLDSLSGSIDDLVASLDSEIYTGGQYVMSAFDDSHRLNNFNGDALEATIETSEFQPFPGKRAELQEVRPIIEGNEDTFITFTPKHRTNLVDDYTIGSPSTINAAGNFPVRANNFYHRGLVTISGGFSTATGIDVVSAKPAGSR